MDAVTATVLVALLAGGFTLLGAWIGSQSEHRKWKRAERLAAYSKFATDIDRIMSQALTAMKVGRPDAATVRASLDGIAELMGPGVAVRLVGPDAVVKAADALARSAAQNVRDVMADGPAHDKARRDDFNQATDRFVAESRKALKLS